MNQKPIGWIGTGVMGCAMCHHLLEKGLTVHLFNRTKEKAHPLLEKGAIFCDSPQKVAEKSEIIFTIVGFPSDVHEVILGERGVLKGASPNTIIVDMTTSSPALARTIHEASFSKSVHALDAPVSGGDIGAKNGTLAIMVGGDRKIFDQVVPYFEIFGENISHMGNPGSGQHTKMCNQILIASTMIGVVESLIYAFKAGMSHDLVIDVIGKGAASSFSINNLGRRIAKRDFTPGFFIKHFVKDMGIALEEAQKMNLSLPGLSLAKQFYISAIAIGLENSGTQGLYKVIEHMNGIKIS